MTFSTITPQNRRGLSSVVGALFFTVLMIAGFSVLNLALDAQTDIVTTQRIVSDVEIKKLQERFGIAVSTDANDRLGVTVSNLGQNPIEISSIWIINKTVSSHPAMRFSINYDDSFVTGSTSSDVLASQPLFMDPDIYDIKVVSSLGTIEIAELDVGPGGSSSNSLRSVLVTDPPDVILGQNVTIGMIVTNTGQLQINDVTPLMPSANPPAAVTASSGPNLSSVNLIPGESFLFLWDYTIDGAADTDVDFSNFATGEDANNNLVQSNVATDTSILREDASGDAGNSELIVLTQDLLAKPEIFIIMPGPFGESTQRAMWGVNIVNPIEKDLKVSKIVINTMSTRYQGGDEIFTDNDGDFCADHIDPGLGGNWGCPMPNQLMWKDLDSPVTVPGFSSVSFLTLVDPGFIKASGEFMETVPVDVNVYTTLGQFGKSGYATSFHEAGTTLTNVYLTDAPGSTANANIFSSIDAIPGGSVIKLNATLADFDSDPTRVIQGDSRLIINIPKGWTNPSVINAPGFTVDDPTPVPFGDGSSQIVGILNSDITGPSNAQTIEFQVTVPDVDSTQLYVMYILADGISSSDSDEDVAISALSEIILQVVKQQP